MANPISVVAEPLIAGRNRLTVAFRLLLAIPPLLIVGGVGLGFAIRSRGVGSSGFGETGVLGLVAYLLGIVSGSTIVFTARQSAGLRQFMAFYLRWRVRSLAYLMLLQDAYPPFGDAPYPAALSFTDETGPRNRLSVGFRVILVIPHLIVLGLLSICWWITAFI